MTKLARVLGGLTLLAGLASEVLAQAPVFASFNREGASACTNLQPGTVASVEWAASVLGPWTNKWAGLEAATADSNGTPRMRVPVSDPVRDNGRTNPPPTPFTPPSKMVWIPGGSFLMGSPTNEVERLSDEVQHTVTVSGFYMSRYEVTQAEYLAVVGMNPSHFVVTNGYGTDLNRPAEQVSWYDATNYCHRLNVREGRLGSGWEYRLPTEAEWEYACRGGATTPFHYGPNLVLGMANFIGYKEYIGGVGTSMNPRGLDVTLNRTTSVGSYQPNGFGLYDMHGNVGEWCLDGYWEYPTGEVVNPRGSGCCSDRVIRGGSWLSIARDARSAARHPAFPGFPPAFFGFRVVLAPVPP